VIAYNAQCADAVEAAYATLAAAVRDDIIVYLTVTDATTLPLLGRSGRTSSPLRRDPFAA